MTTNYRSDVFTNELDASFAVQINASSYAIMLGASSEGPLTAEFITGSDEFIRRYGIPNAAVSRMHHSALAFLETAGGCWVKRVAASDATFGGVMFQNIGSAGSRTLSRTVLTQSDPENVDLSGSGALVSADDDDDNLFYIYAIGPGSYSSNIQVEVTSQNIIAPTLAVAEKDAAGNTTTDDYNYVMTSFNVFGETTVGNTVSFSKTTGHIATLSWNAIQGASGYKIYRRDDGETRWDLLASVGPDITSYDDTNGSDGPKAVDTSSQPSTNNPENLDYFNILVYDTRVSKTVAQETWELSFEPRINGFGVQTEIEQQINENSTLIRVVKNTALGTIPTMTSLEKITLSAGATGSTITDADLSTAIDEFDDKEAFPAALFLDSGFTTVAYHKKLIALAEERKDSIAFLTVPVAKQDAQDSIEYRSVTLNANSNRGALFTNDHLVKDPYNDISLFVPASAIAGARLAYTDRVANAAFSPAGFRRGVANSTIRLRHKYSNSERDNMAFNGVNYFTTERGYGIVLREAYTLQSAFSALSYIPVRRVIDIAQQSTERAQKIFLHEPNDEILSAQIVSLLRDFYSLMVQRRMIRRFEVFSNTPANEVQLGNITIYSLITPLLPAVRIKHTTVITGQDISFSELIEQL